MNKELIQFGRDNVKRLIERKRQNRIIRSNIAFAEKEIKRKSSEYSLVEEFKEK